MILSISLDGYRFFFRMNVSDAMSSLNACQVLQILRIPNGLRSCVVYKFSCAGCAACYVGETTRHFNTRVREHLETDRASHIFKHLESSSVCRSACSRDNFAIIDQASSRLALKIKEALHIFWDKPTGT